MADPFSDYNLMNENIGYIERDVRALRVSAEHYLWLCSARSTIAAITHTAGGEVEGHPTSVINVLQRIRQLVKIEAALASIANNTCCEGCQEAARVAKAALRNGPGHQC